MNIQDTLDIFAGGPGSGPKAPCPDCGPHHKAHTMEEGDVVKIKTPVKLYNKRTGNVDTISNAKGTVVTVLPKVGDNPQMVKVQVHSPSKNHEDDYMQYTKMNDLEIHQAQGIGRLPMWTNPWFKPGPDTSPEWKKLGIQPVPKGQVVTKYKTAEGADVTIVRPKEETETTPKTLKDISQEAHYLKGQFALIDSTKGVQDRPGMTRVTKMYDTSGLPAHLQKGAGAVLWIDTYTQKGKTGSPKIKEVTVNEQNYTTFGMKTRGTITFSYKNAAQAVGMLKQRYGIKTSMERLVKSFKASYEVIATGVVMRDMHPREIAARLSVRQFTVLCGAIEKRDGQRFGIISIEDKPNGEKRVVYELDDDVQHEILVK